MWVRAEAARREFAFLRRAWPRLTVLVLVAAVFITGLSLLVHDDFLRGLVVGVLSTTVVALIAVLTLEVSGTAATRMGGTAEQWTASELRPLRRSGWRLINHYLLGVEVDHLLIGPAGVIVVETKWSRTRWHLDIPDRFTADAVTQVNRAAQQVALWDVVKKAGCPVRPVLFLWSSEPGDSAIGSQLVFRDGVTILQGRRSAAAWRQRVEQAAPHLTSAAVEALAAAAVDKLAQRDRHEAARQPPPPSFDRISRTVFGSFLAALAGMYLMLEVLSHGLYWPALAVGIAAFGLGIYARRFKPLRRIADAWLAAIGGVGVLAIVLLTVT